MEKWILLLADELRKPLPGTVAQMLMSPSVHRPPVADTPLRKGAVTLLLYKQKGRICTVFIRRVEYEGVHRTDKFPAVWRNLRPFNRANSSQGKLVRDRRICIDLTVTC
jgi:hypothetical protein